MLQQIESKTENILNSLDKISSQYLNQKKVYYITSVSILKETWRAITTAAASWSNPDISSCTI